jgi:hypothetical protein
LPALRCRKPVTSAFVAVSDSVADPLLRSPTTCGSRSVSLLHEFRKCSTHMVIFHADVMMLGNWEGPMFL